MSLTYDIPRNSPQSSVRMYRFPYRGERWSERMNFLISAVHGDLKHIYSVLDDTEDVALGHLGGITYLVIPKLTFGGNPYRIAGFKRLAVTFNSVTVTATDRNSYNLVDHISILVPLQHPMCYASSFVSVTPWSITAQMEDSEVIIEDGPLGTVLVDPIEAEARVITNWMLLAIEGNELD